MTKNRLLTKVRRAIEEEKLLQPQEKVIVGVSGGADSLFLLEALSQLKPLLGIELVIAHLNHGLRGWEADRDEEFVRNLAQAKKLKFYSQKIQLKNLKGSLEEQARWARYQFFTKVAQKEDTLLVALAHQADDQIETVLLNLLRGSGLRGTLGMDYKTKMKIGEKEFIILRPLLDIWRAEIEGYLKKRGLSWRTDQSNFDLRFKRNQIRHQLIPALEKINPRFKKIFLAQLKKRRQAYLKRQSRIEKIYFSLRHPFDQRIFVPPSLALDLGKFLSLSQEVQREVLRRAIWELFSHLRGFERTHFQEMINFLKKPKPGCWKQFPHHLIIYKNYDHFILTTQKPRVLSLERTKVKIPGLTLIGQEDKIKTQLVKNPKPNSQFTIFVDYDKVKDGLWIESVKEGDYFYPEKFEGKKKISDYFIDLKIPRLERGCWPLLKTAKGEIVWVCGLRADRRFSPTNQSSKFLKISYQKGKSNGV